MLAANAGLSDGARRRVARRRVASGALSAVAPSVSCSERCNLFSHPVLFRWFRSEKRIVHIRHIATKLVPGQQLSY